MTQKLSPFGMVRNPNYLVTELLRLFCASPGKLGDMESSFPTYLENRYPLPLARVATWILGLGLLILSARIAIPLPGTPVPVTGQTFGVALLALFWGARFSTGIFLSYGILGSLGLPIFAQGRAGLSGPTFGYLIGMLVASWVIGRLADRGWTRSFWRTLAACFLGSLATFTCGLIGLSFFLPAGKLLASGWFPFIPGDILKSSLAAFLAYRVRGRRA